MENLLDMALKYEKNAKWDLAESYYKRAFAESPDNKDVLFNYGGCLFNMGKYEEALEALIRCYMHPLQNDETKAVIFEHIFSAYYKPNEAVFRANYEKNVSLLKTYENSYLQNLVSFDELPVYCIPASDKRYYIWEKGTKVIQEGIVLSEIPVIWEEISPGNTTAALNVYNVKELESISMLSTDPRWHDGKLAPIYLIWTSPVLVATFLQVIDYTPVISGGRTFFFDSYALGSPFADFLMDPQAIPPDQVVGDQKHFQSFHQLIKQIIQYRTDDRARKEAAIAEYYATHTWEYYRDLFNRWEKMRILFSTSRFSDVVQYCARDMAQACRNHGITCEVFKENSFFHRSTYDATIGKIYEFKPDIIFILSNLKSQVKVEFPENLMFVSWIQDPKPVISSPEHASKFGKHDFILAHSKRFIEQMVTAGFPAHRIFYQTVPVDDDIFRPYELTPDEQVRYSADVAICANYNTIPEKMLQEWIDDGLKATGQDRHPLLIKLMHEIYNAFDLIIQKGGLIAGIPQSLTIIKDIINRLKIKELSDTDKWAEKFYLRLSYGLHRKYILKAILEAGFNFKLWGNHWKASPEFAPYAMGNARHGEELAKVYSSSKIVIGTFSHYSAHLRVWETMLCGALCLVRYIPPEFDYLDIRDYLTENEDFVFYHNQDDLIEKIRYYLQHEEERKRIAENGRRRVKEKLTYQETAGKWLEFIKNSLNTY